MEPNINNPQQTPPASPTPPPAPAAGFTQPMPGQTVSPGTPANNTFTPARGPVAPNPSPLPVLPVPDDTSNSGQPPMPAPRRRSYKPLILILVLIFVLSGSAAAYYFGYYMNSSVILSQSLSDTGKGYNSLVDYFDSQSKASYKGSTGQGSYSIKADNFTTDGSLSFNSDGQNSDATIDIGYGTGRVKGEVRTVKAASGTAPDVYLKASGISGLGPLLGSPELSSALNQYDGKWLQVDHTLLENLSSAANPTASLTQSENLPSRDQIADELHAFGNVSQQYVFTTNKDKSVTTVVKKYGVESVDGHKAYHYTLALDKAHVKQYISAQQAALKSSKLDAWLKKNNLESDVDSSFKDMQSSADKIKSSDTFDLWADVKTRLVYKIRVNDKTAKNPAANYVDIGLNYKGGSSYPFFISEQTKDSSSSTNASVVITLDSKTNSAGLKVDFKSTGNAASSGTVNFTFKPTNDVQTISAPSGAVPLSQVLNQLGLSDLLTQAVSSANSTTSSGNAKDAKRQSDIQALQTQLEAFFSQNGYYPSLADINNATWRRTNMQSLDSNSLQDPDSSSKTLAAIPAAKVYAYKVTNSSGGSCESDDTSCAKYTLTATLSNGKTDVVNNLD
jgi:hypothetical protein